MIKLIQWEWKKNEAWKYVRNAAIMTVCMLLLTLTLFWQQQGNNMIQVGVPFFTHIGYLMMTGVMLSAFFVSNYKNKTMQLMFLYPIKRQKILASKLLAVWIFNVVALVLSKLLIYGALLLIIAFGHISTVQIPVGEASFYANILASSAVTVSICYIAVPIGLKLKSSRAVIVTATVLAAFTQRNIGVFSAAENLSFYGMLLILAMVSVYLSVYKVETCDV